MIALLRRSDNTDIGVNPYLVACVQAKGGDRDHVEVFIEGTIERSVVVIGPVAEVVATLNAALNGPNHARSIRRGDQPE
jgi:hypothetical protein